MLLSPSALSPISPIFPSAPFDAIKPTEPSYITPPPSSGQASSTSFSPIQIDPPSSSDDSIDASPIHASQIKTFPGTTTSLPPITTSKSYPHPHPLPHTTSTSTSSSTYTHPQILPPTPLSPVPSNPMLNCPSSHPHSTGPFRHCYSPVRAKVPLLTLRIPDTSLTSTNRAYMALNKRHQHEALRLGVNASPYPRAGAGW